MEKIIVSAIDDSHIPTRAHDTDAGFDVRARDNYIIPAKGMINIPIGVKVAMPNGMVCLVFPRSSLPLKKGLVLANSVGVVDAGYRGEIHMQLYNLSDREVVIEHNEKIGQLLFMNYSSDIEISPKYNSFEEEYPSDRGTGGFGSTGN